MGIFGRGKLKLHRGPMVTPSNCKFYMPPPGPGARPFGGYQPMGLTMPEIDIVPPRGGTGEMAPAREFLPGRWITHRASIPCEYCGLAFGNGKKCAKCGAPRFEGCNAVER